MKMPTDFASSLPEPAADAPGARNVELRLATDFDGTVSPIVTDPDAAHLDPIVRSVLGRAGGDPRICIAGARRIVFAGDDTTDFAALAFAAPRGRAIFIESSERSAPDVEPLHRVTGVEPLCRLFEQEIDRAVGQLSDE